MKDRTRSGATTREVAAGTRECTGADLCSSLKCSPFPFGRTLASSQVGLGRPTSTSSARTWDLSTRNFP